MKRAFVCIGDTHLGLKTDGVDRCDEILEIFKTVVAEAKSLQNNGYKTRLILGGDLFDDHDPGEDLIAVFIKILNMTREAELTVDVLIGNHEAVPDPERLSCLSFLREIKDGYPGVTLREKLLMLQVETKKLFVSFLPHVSRATMKHFDLDYRSTQDYIDDAGKRLVEAVPAGAIHLAFSHLNVRQSHPGSEANLLKKSEAFLPMAYVNTPPGAVEPQIVNFHIHERQAVGNVRIVGSPLYCSFGETQEKTFTTVIVEDGEVSFVEKPTPFVPFFQTDIEILGEEEVDVYEVLAPFIDQISPWADISRPPVVKIGVTITAEKNSYNWQTVATGIRAATNNGVHLLPIAVKVVQKRVVRNVKQKPSLEPDDAVKVYLKANLKTDPDRMKRIYKKSKPYIGDTQ